MYLPSLLNLAARSGRLKLIDATTVRRWMSARSALPSSSATKTVLESAGLKAMRAIGLRVWKGNVVEVLRVRWKTDRRFPTGLRTDSPSGVKTTLPDVYTDPRRFENWYDVFISGQCASIVRIDASREEVLFQASAKDEPGCLEKNQEGRVC